ncbi:hypothetical protein ACFVIM_31120 [Streptomyces sp. NPDC057638]|uniref:hypothetical protein n=1 Tax=Streptomyces sp. NPDC057638 TaxID=3346190 RepID=UPI0036A3FB1C
MPDCVICQHLTTAEKAAERVHDHSRATDYRVLLHRHLTTDHPPQEGASATVVT